MNTSRREFVRTLAAAAAVAPVFPAIAQDSTPPSRVVRVGVMGLGRGMAHVNAYTSIPGVEVAYVCDVDSRRAMSAAQTVEKKTKKRPEMVSDFRRILEDKTVDALSIAAPNFWHTPAAILACDAGKHVYVEKPGSHTAQESQWIVAAAKKWKRHVQMGNQRRSMPHCIEAVQKLRDGAIGRLRYARSWYVNARGSIGIGLPKPVPEWLDYELWQGPTPDMPYKDNLVPYNWHWMWHWGGGEIENNGPHFLDLLRWGLGVNAPLTVSCSGGRYHFEDDQETPDTGGVTFDFGKVGASWEWSSCHPRKGETYPLCTFYGDGGSLELHSANWRILDLKGAETAAGKGSTSDVPHFTNFVNVIRGDEKKLNSEIADAQRSAMLCHLGNIAYRSGQVIRYDGAKKQIVNSKEAMKYWGRTYRRGWEFKV